MHDFHQFDRQKLLVSGSGTITSSGFDGQWFGECNHSEHRKQHNWWNLTASGSGNVNINDVDFTVDRQFHAQRIGHDDHRQLEQDSDFDRPDCSQ